MKRELVGYVTVDAGILYLGDPCYQSDDKCDFKDWHEFCKKLDFESDVTILEHNPGMPGKGIICKTPFGDGAYPVYIKRDKDGFVSEFTIKF